MMIKYDDVEKLVENAISNNYKIVYSFQGIWKIYSPMSNSRIQITLSNKVITIIINNGTVIRVDLDVVEKAKAIILQEKVKEYAYNYVEKEFFKFCEDSEEKINDINQLDDND